MPAKKKKNKKKKAAKKKHSNIKNKNKKRKKEPKPQQRIRKLNKLYNLNSLAPSARIKTELLISGFVRNNTRKSAVSSDIINLCFNFAADLFSILSFTQCQALIQQFIDKKIIDNQNKQFECILNAKWDGFDGATFHKKCNYKGATLTVIKSNYDYIFGGFTTVSWRKPNIKKGINEYALDYNAFLFSFYLSTDRLEIYDIDFNHAAFAIEHTLDKGPTFGYSDIMIAPEKCDTEQVSYCKTSCYQINGSANKLCGGNDDSIAEGYYGFVVGNIEVFAFR